MPINLEDLIISEAEHFVVINKPTNLVVNRSETAKSTTLQDLVEASNILNRKKDIPEAKNVKDLDTLFDEFTARSGIVHRLDKNTSGVLLVAKDIFGFYVLKKQFVKRKVKKEYHAVVWGDFLKSLEDKDYILVDLPIDRSPRNRQKFAIVATGRPAVTKVYSAHPLLNKKLNYVGTLEGNVFSFVKALPKTGRTHQIRVHLKALNHEILGDDIYQGKKQNQFSQKHNFPLMLHAYKLNFKFLNKLYKFKADYPKEFKESVQKIDWSI